MVVVVVVLMVVVMAVGGRDGGGTPHSENVPTHSASLDGWWGGSQPGPTTSSPLDWIGFEQLARSIGLNSLGLEPNPSHCGGLEQNYRLDWKIWSGSIAILKQRVEQL